MANVQIPGIAENITAPNRPWIYYGVSAQNFEILTSMSHGIQGSYAGARSAHMRVLYPELVYGAIASSGVTYATISDWEYFDIIRQFAPSNCVKQLETAVEEFDDLISNPKTRQTIKALYGLPNVTHDADVGSLLSVSCTHTTPIHRHSNIGHRNPLDHGRTRIGTQLWGLRASTISAMPLELLVRTKSLFQTACTSATQQLTTLHTSIGCGEANCSPSCRNGLSSPFSRQFLLVAAAHLPRTR